MSQDFNGLRELYQEVIFDHNRSPRNFEVIENASHFANGHNPLCGDQLAVYAVVEDGIVQKVSFVGHGCAISKASASLMTEAVKGLIATLISAVLYAWNLVLQRQQLAEDLVTWFGILTMAALLVASVLAYRQRR